MIDLAETAPEMAGYAGFFQALAKDTGPILAPAEWILECRVFHAQVVQETLELDWRWIREQRPELLPGCPR